MTDFWPPAQFVPLISPVTGLPRRAFETISASAVAVSLTGTTAETPLATYTMPGGTMGPNGILRITTGWSHTNNANVKMLRARLGGIGGAQYLNAPATSLARTSSLVAIQNRGLQASQIGLTHAAASAPYGTAGVAQVTSTIDTSIAQDIVLTGQLATSTDTITLESWVIEVCYLP